MKQTINASLATLALALGLTATAQEIRFLCYGDGFECETYELLAEQFAAEQDGATVVVDEVGYDVIRDQLEARLQAGEAPDLARVTNLGGLNPFYLDLTPYVDADYWEANFGALLPWTRGGSDDNGIYGLQDQLTVTGPYINVSLFEEAGVALPGEGASWDDWASAAAAVQAELGLYSGMVMDRSGHRFAGIAMSQGAGYFDEAGEPALIDDGFKAAVETMKSWHDSGLMPIDSWPGASGDTWTNEAGAFQAQDAAIHISGSWMIGRYDAEITDFEWRAIAAPCGAAGCGAMPGGAAVVGFKDSAHPEVVAAFIDFLAREDNARLFYERNLLIPSHAGLAASGLNYPESTSDAAAGALAAFTASLVSSQNTTPQAFALQGYRYNFVIYNATVNYVSQYMANEIDAEEAYAKIEEDIAKGIAE